METVKTKRKGRDLGPRTMWLKEAQVGDSVTFSDVTTKTRVSVQATIGITAKRKGMKISCALSENGLTCTRVK